MAIFRYPKIGRKALHGDTLVEVMFAVGIFGLVSISAISLMNRGLQNAQNALEITMARQEIDTQAEALRFLHEAYIIEKATDDERYTKAWEEIISKSYSFSEYIPGISAVSPPTKLQPAFLQPFATPLTISATISGIFFHKDI